jgi:uncharacterized protein (DUF1697 family)
MTTYTAFLRGINVSGQKRMKMDELRKVLSDAGFDQVTTLIQSGNIVFRASEASESLLEKQIEDTLEQYFGFRAETFVRDLNTISNIISLIRQVDSSVDRRLYVTFLKNPLEDSPGFPLYSRNRDVVLLQSTGSEVISESLPFKDGFGFPNAFIENLTRMPATTRNPDTLSRLLDLTIS